MRANQQPYEDLEGIIEFDFLRATEAAALNTLPWIGEGENKKLTVAACDAIRGMFDLVTFYMMKLAYGTRNPNLKA